MRDDIGLFATVYDTIIDPSGWDDVVKRIVGATKSLSGGVFIHIHFDRTRLAASYNIDPFYADAFVQTYYKINPFEAEAATMAPGEIRTGSHITQTDRFRASAFCNEFARPQGWADDVRVGLLRTPNVVEILALQRSHDAVWVEPAEWQLLETLAPHLKRATEVHQLLSRTRTTTDSLAATVSAAGFAVFLLTDDCHVAFANAKAEELVRQGVGLRYERGRLATTTPALTARLHGLARESARPARAQGDIGGTLELSRGEDCQPLLAHVIPLAPNRVVSLFDIDRPAVAVFVVDPSADLGAQIRRFAARFGLTAGETRVLGEIIGGNGLPAAAARLKISPATARTHAYRIFEKTGTNRQAELIRRFFECSVPTHPVALELP